MTGRLDWIWIPSRMPLRNNFWINSIIFFFSILFSFSISLVFKCFVLFLNLGAPRFCCSSECRNLRQNWIAKLDKSVQISRLSVSFFIQIPFGTDYAWNQQWFFGKCLNFYGSKEIIQDENYLATHFRNINWDKNKERRSRKKINKQEEEFEMVLKKKIVGD